MLKLTRFRDLPRGGKIAGAVIAAYALTILTVLVVDLFRVLTNRSALPQLSLYTNLAIVIALTWVFIFYRVSVYSTSEKSHQNS